jgi:AraC-like DNA-binding protein
VELLGQATQAYQIGVKGHNVLLGVRFFPHTAALFLRGGVGEFTNTVADLSAVLGNDLDALYRRLQDTERLPEQIGLVQEFLLKQLNYRRQEGRQYKMMEWSIAQLLAQKENNCLEKTAFQAGISLRYLEKTFGEFLGVSPKLFVKITRLQKSFAYLHRRSCSLTEVAFASGYYDQSHFIRDFKSFTGMTPSQYVPERFPLNSLFLQNP